MAEFESLTDAVQRQLALQTELKALKEETADRIKALEAQIVACQRFREFSGEGLDQEKIALAQTVVSVFGRYEDGGKDRDSVLSDAIRQFATGAPVRQRYGDLWHVYFGTKNYADWRGQREDHDYGYGPRHGATVFAIRLRDEVRKAPQYNLTAEQIEACIYFLTNLPRVEAAEKRARAAA